MLCKARRNISPVTGIWREENNLWLLHQFYKINVIPSCEQWGINFASEFKFSVVTVHNSKVGDSFAVQISVALQSESCTVLHPKGIF